MNNELFLIGAATAGHQVEGNNIGSDIWAMEQMKYGGYPEKSLDAADHYNRYKEDIKLLKEAGLNSYRFSFDQLNYIFTVFVNREEMPAPV